MSFNFTRDINNKPIKKNITYSQAPKITSNRTALSNTNSVNLQQLSINNVPITASGNNINSLDTTIGTATANKAIVLDQTKNISNINTITINSLTVNNQSITGIYQNNNPSNSNSPYIKGIQSGLVDNNKLATVDSNLDIKTANNISSNSLTLNKNNLKFNTNGSTKIKTTIINGDYINFIENYNIILPVNVYFIDIYYAESINIYIACSHYAIYRSTNGKNWNIVLENDRLWSFGGISYSITENIFIIIQGTKIYRSSNNGLTWTIISSPTYTITNYATPVSHIFRSIDWSPTLNKFSIISFTETYLPSPYSVMKYSFFGVTSTDGITWVYTGGQTNWTQSNNFRPQSNYLTWNNDRQVFEYLTGNEYCYSSNGSNYTVVTTLNSVNKKAKLWVSDLQKYYGINNGYLAYGTDYNIDNFISTLSVTDITWISSIQKFMYPGIFNGKKRIFFISPNLDKVYISNITQFSLSPYYPNKNIKDENGNLLYYTNDSSVLYSIQYNVNIDLDFNKLSVNSNNLNIGFQSICRSDSLNLFVAISNTNSNQQIATSPDGLTWTLRNTPNNNWTSVSWSSKLNLFVAVSNSGNNRVMTSSNGINWSTENINYSSYHPTITKNNLAISNTFSLFLLDNGTIFGCGTESKLGNSNYQGASYRKSVFIMVENINTAIAIAAGTSHSLALLSNGTIKAWGDNTNGKLGNNNTTASLPPVNVSNINNAIAISAGSEHSLALLSNGTIMSWGINNFGQLGNGNNTNSLVPVLVSNINNAIAISSGANYSLALLSNGAIMSWGLNSSGQLGNGNNTDSNIPVNVSNINNAVAISAGSVHSLALLSNGTVMSWGLNNFAQLGNSTFISSNIPVLVSNINNAIEISATSENSYIIDSNYILKACGNKFYGQIGNNTSGSGAYSTFQNVSDVSNVVSIAQGSSSKHMILLTKQNILYSFGYNNVGQLGIDSIINSIIPTYVLKNSSNNDRFKEIIKLNYTTNNLSFINNNWISIVWNNMLQMFAALSNTGTNNNIMTSIDGFNWISKFTPSNSEWTNLSIFDSYIFMVISSKLTTISTSKIIYSLDGISWHEYLNTTQKVLWFNKKYLALQSNESIYIANSYSISDGFLLLEYKTPTIESNIKISPYNDYKQYYINKLDITIYISNSINIIYYTYDNLNLIPLNFSNLTNISGWSDIVWSDTLNYFILVSSSNSSNKLIKSEPSSILSTYINKTIISRNKYNNSFKQINPYYTMSSNTTVSFVQWIPELNFFYSSLGRFQLNQPINSNYYLQGINLVYSPKLKLFISSLSSPTNYDNSYNTALGVYTSTNCNNWSSQKIPVSSSTSLGNWSTAYWSSELNMFLLGNINTTTQTIGTYPRILISYDGIIWTSVLTNTGQGTAVTKFSWIDKYKMLITNNNYYTYDGLSWLSTYSSDISILYSPILDKIADTSSITGVTSSYYLDEINLFIALTSSNLLYISTNGSNWKIYSTPAPFSRLVWAKELGVILFTTSTTSTIPIYICNLYTSNMNLSYFNSNTITNYKNNSVNNWYTKKTPSNTWKFIVYSSDLNLFVAISNSGSNNRIMTSSDGWNWTSRISAVDNDWTSICYSYDLELFVAVSNSGSNNRVMTSSDGINWTSRTSVANNNWTSICYSSELNLFVAVSNSGTGNRVMTSNNGINWTSRTSAADNNWTSICWSEIGLFVAVSNSGSNNRVMTSIDGITWTIRNTPINNNWTSICWASHFGLFIVVANSGIGNRIMTSNNGIDWTIRNSPVDNDWTSICYADELNLVIGIANSGTNRIMKSNDGINWITMPTENKDWQSICWAKELGIFAAVSASNSNNDIIISNIAIIGIHNNVSALDSVITGTNNSSNKTLRLGGINSFNQTLNLNSNSNNELLRLTYNNSNSNYTNIDLNSTGSQLNIEVNGTNKIFNIVNHDSLNKGLKLQNSLLTANATDLNKLDSEFGIASNSKILSVNNNKNISNINNLSLNKIFVNNNLLLTNNDNNNSYLQNIIPGTSQASKCIVPDSNLNISNLNTLNSKIININKTNIVNEPSLIDYKFNKELNSGSLIKKYPSNINVYSICWSPELSLFVAVGDCWGNTNGSFYKIMTSNDGINWESRYTFFTGILYGICWSPELSLFVAVGSLGRILTSVDGTIWITRTNPAGSITMTSITWSNTLNLFVAIANTGTYRIITSPNGITWTNQTSFTNTSNWSSIIWASGLSLFVAVANSGTTTTQIATSSNGATWTLRTSPIANTWMSVTYSSSLNLLVAVSNSGTNNRVMTSSNGTTWTSRTSAADNNWTSVSWASGLSLFIAVSTNGTNNRIMKSTDGTSWSLVDTTNLNIDYNAISYSSNLNLIVAGGLSTGTYSNNKIVTSIDSNNWILRDTNYDGWNKILWIPSLNSYVGCASSSGYMKRIIKSSDGINWSLFSTNLITDYNNYLIQDIIFIPELNLFIAIGNTFIIKSTDLENWTNCTLPTGTLNLRSIIWSSSLNLLVAVGNSGTMSSRILTSSDGINWTLQNHPLLTTDWYSVTWSSSLNLFSIISYSNYYNQVITSLDGINWVLRTTSTVPYVLTNINWISQLNLFIGTGTSNFIIKSTDGINWSTTSINTNDGTSMSSVLNQFSWINKYNMLVGVSTNNGNSQNTLVYTYDANIWYTLTLPYFNNNSYSSIVYSNELEQFIVYTNSSSNPFAPFITYNLNSIIQNPSLSINLNNISNLIKPNDTMVNNAINNWNSVIYSYNNNLTSICYSSHLKMFVALSNTGISTRVIRSTDGLSWLTKTSAADNNWTSICWSFKLKLFVAVANSGTGNRIMTSPDGDTWIIRTSPADNNWLSVCWSNELNLFLAVANSGTNNRFMISSNGIDWGTITVNNNNDWTSICWAPELSLFVAVASTGINNRIMTSNNGFDWTSRVNPIDNNWTSVCWAPELSLFVAVASTGINNRIMTSSDGIIWTSRSNPVDNNWTSVCWAPELLSFIAVANSGTNNRIMKSRDGINWSIDSINYNSSIVGSSLTLNTIAGGNNHTLILLNSNTVSGIGSNSNGQLCESTTTSQRTSANSISSNLYNVIALTAGNNYSLVLLSNGTIQGFGINNYGQLGDSSTTQRTNQVNVTGINNAINISAGPSGNHSLALLNDNTVKAWGHNFYGQLGNATNIGTNTANSIPSLISNLNNVIMIKAGNNHSLALLNNGTIMAWGLNDRGQLGDGTITNSSNPVLVSGINNAIAIAAGDKHSVALLSDGTIKTWGSNEFNQLGNSTNATTINANSTALSVLNITNAIAIASGSNHCLALLSDNTIRSWGRNADGQLGNSGTTSSFTPVTVTSVSGAIGISAGDVHSLALINNGTIRAWGDNTSGKLGDSTIVDKSTSITVSGISNAKYNQTSNSNYANNDWAAICWNPDLKIFATVSSSGTNNRIMISSNDSILSRETVIKNLNNSFNIDQSNDRIGLNIANPGYQLHLSTDSVAKPGTSTWTVSSDIRLKEDIENADLDICYNNIKNLALKKYKWKDEYITSDKVLDRHKLGWIAQEVETILPKSVNMIDQYGFTDCKTLNTDQIIASMHGCVKKLLNIYETQNNKINNLNQDINDMKTFMNNL